MSESVGSSAESGAVSVGGCEWFDCVESEFWVIGNPVILGTPGTRGTVPDIVGNSGLTLNPGDCWKDALFSGFRPRRRH